MEAIGRGGVFDATDNDHRDAGLVPALTPDKKIRDVFNALPENPQIGRSFGVAPGIRFFDGRGKDRSWLSEIPDPITKVAWQNPVLAHPETLAKDHIRHGEIIRMTSENGGTHAPVYAAPTVRKGVYMMALMPENSRKKPDTGATHPLSLLSSETLPISGGPRWDAALMSVHGTGRMFQFAHTDGSRSQLNRKIALTVPLKKVLAHQGNTHHGTPMGLSMAEFPLTLPLPEGYDPKRDFYPPHDHDGYRWSMMVDLDRCIGCGACAAALLCGEQYRCGRRRQNS